MLISQLYSSSPHLNDTGFEILQKWYQQPAPKKAAIMEWLAAELRTNRPGNEIAVELARHIGVPIDSKFPPPRKIP